MNENDFTSIAARRRFLARVGAGIGVLGVTTAGASAAAGQSATGERFQPARHEQDDWFDQLPGKHRFVFDTTLPEGFATVLAFANNFFEANKSGYGLQDKDLAVV